MMKEPFGGLILNVAFRMLVPFTITYGIYVLCLGEFSPGGGFQAGALLSVGVLLARLILGFDTKFNVLGKTSVVVAGVGTFLYAFTGWLTLFGGADFFLNYNYMPIHLNPQHEMHAMGIFLIEIGVAICVMMTIINLLDAIVKITEAIGLSALKRKRTILGSMLSSCAVVASSTSILASTSCHISQKKYRIILGTEKPKTKYFLLPSLFGTNSSG